MRYQTSKRGRQPSQLSRRRRGKDVNVKLQYTIAWAGAMNAVMAYVREMKSRCPSEK